MRSNRLAVASFLSAVLCFPSVAHAHSCFLDGKPKTHHQVLQDLGKALDSARAVFSGEVTSSTWTRITFNVERVWKGELGAEVAMITGHTQRSDGTVVLNPYSYGFAVGQKYLVFAYGKSSSEMMASNCSRTAPLNHAKRALELLEQLEKPLVDVSHASRPYDELRVMALRFFDAVERADKPKLIGLTNSEARVRVAMDLGKSRSLISKILLTGRNTVRARFRAIRNPGLLLLQHPDLISPSTRTTVCFVNPIAKGEIPRTLRDIPGVEGSTTDVCVPFIRSKNQWTVSYEFAYFDWDPLPAP